MIDVGRDLAVVVQVDFADTLDLVPLAVPSKVDLSATRQVVAAISTGPNSDLAAAITVRAAAARRR